jgi:hypothetical protein
VALEAAVDQPLPAAQPAAARQSAVEAQRMPGSREPTALQTVAQLKKKAQPAGVLREAQTWFELRAEQQMRRASPLQEQLLQAASLQMVGQSLQPVPKTLPEVALVLPQDTRQQVLPARQVQSAEAEPQLPSFV